MNKKAGLGEHLPGTETSQDEESPCHLSCVFLGGSGNQKHTAGSLSIGYLPSSYRPLGLPVVELCGASEHCSPGSGGSMFRGHSIALCLTGWPPTPTGHLPVPVASQSHFTDDETEAQKTSMIGPQSLNNRVPSRCRQMLTLLWGNISTALGEQGNNGNPFSDHGEGNTRHWGCHLV